jgi:hypothetical protein
VHAGAGAGCRGGRFSVKCRGVWVQGAVQAGAGACDAEVVDYVCGAGCMCGCSVQSSAHG